MFVYTDDAGRERVYSLHSRALGASGVYSLYTFAPGPEASAQVAPLLDAALSARAPGATRAAPAMAVVVAAEPTAQQLALRHVADWNAAHPHGRVITGGALQGLLFPIGMASAYFIAASRPSVRAVSRGQ